MKSDQFNKLLKEYNTNEDSCRAILDMYYPYILMRAIRRYGSKDLGNSAAKYFFDLLMETEIPQYIENPAIWVHNICDNFLKEKYGQDPNDDNDSVVEFCKFAFGEEQFRKVENCDSVTFLILVISTCEGYSFEEIAKILRLEVRDIEQIYAQALKTANEVRHDAG